LTLPATQRNVAELFSRWNRILNRHVGALRWIIRSVFRDTIIKVRGESQTPLWFFPSEYPILLLGPGRVERDIGREWSRLLRPDEIIFDIGANIGFTAQRFFALLGGRCRIWAFEPLPRNADLLERNVAGLANTVQTVRCAVGDHDGTVMLTDNRRHGGLSRLQQLNAASSDDAAFWRDTVNVEVPLITLDSFVTDRGAVHPSFIKLDVEGAAHWALQGAVRTLRDCKPVVSCSFHSVEERSGVVKVLRSLGYRGVAIDAELNTRWCEPEDSTGNFVHPADPRAQGFT
jgi:FkbM family methyltransferase